MEKSEQKKPQFTDELTIPDRTRDWDALIQTANKNAAYSPEKVLTEAEFDTAPTENTAKSRFQGDLLLKHYESQTEFRIPNSALQAPFFIGRADLNTGFVPEVNLTRLDTKHKTVSRCHAVISPHGELLVVTDQKSLNGTYLNSQRLIPGQTWILRNGDILRLGKICLIVYFVNEN
jgi:pSer/pThr/pTyr-binding forkhead associated (FHA) protein